MAESTKAASHARTGAPPYRARMAAPPDSTKVNPDTPINSERSRRSLCCGFFQSAKYRAPPTLAMRACSPCGKGADFDSICAVLVIEASLLEWLPAQASRLARPAQAAGATFRECRSSGRVGFRRASHVGLDHLRRVDDAIEFGLRHKSQFQ